MFLKERKKVIQVHKIAEIVHIMCYVYNLGAGQGRDGRERKTQCLKVSCLRNQLGKSKL